MSRLEDLRNGNDIAMLNLNHGKILAHCYIWPKLGHYLFLVHNHITHIDARTIVESLQFFLNVPVYLMCIAYLFNFRLPFRIILIPIYVIALFDEVQYFVRHIGRGDSGLGSFSFELHGDFATLVMIAPLYTIAFLYLFASRSIWHNRSTTK